eukprot:6112393-Alexandrium_andersonii.AAC.1
MVGFRGVFSPASSRSRPVSYFGSGSRVSISAATVGCNHGELRGPVRDAADQRPGWRLHGRGGHHPSRPCARRWATDGSCRAHSYGGAGGAGCGEV